MKPVLLLSNGHGEDLSGALVASQLIQRGIAVEALPLVGHGTSYRQLGIPVLGRTRNCSTGGLGYTSLAGRIAELLEGQMLYVLNRLLLLRRRRRHYGLVLAVGDLLAVVGGWFSGLPTAVYLVAYSSHYEGRLRLPWPCGWLLGRPGIRAIWSRDELSAADLSGQLGRPASFLGNPFLDAVSGNEAPPAGAGDPELLLVPGSRLPEAARNLALMLELLAQLPRGRRLRLRAALVPGLERACIAQLAAPLGWQLEGEDRLVRGPLELELSWGGFGQLLPRAQLVLCSAGTAAEQAVGLAIPVLQLPGQGPQFTPGFAEAQRRLLGAGVFCAPDPASAAELAHQLLEQQLDPIRGPALRRQLATIGQERIGRPGGSQAMAGAIMNLLAASAR
ncbi:lipid-A-disaccharide synthase-related protein [Synechococcus sp. CS-1331]|uniref:lipid-A-disaccharide synthase-related protein n=1 Tax=Synechococcus sp. CS-1331 TaxID=2847973 RepID=UPI00223B0A84|nr:lipid-A-disaccharide synthase-related protein [Synechococcus sp. CS-1331]MCT0228283.1 lipid-A-disaccharide synthase-related protein [Synechococcus sp. CS-1331]